MRRDIEQELYNWFTNIHRLPLLIRGARQIGKTHVVESFAKKYFKNFLTINFELEPQYSACFESLLPQDILMQIIALSGHPIIPGETLLFFDEIQTCPRAITALRYFKERLPTLHVIGAGSLLEFALRDEDLSVPVGRIQYVYMKPLSFLEFLEAKNYSGLIETLKLASLQNSIKPVLHEKLNRLVREYFIVGGMPAVVDAYKEKDYLYSQRLQTSILSTYRSDFGKYAKQTDHKYLQLIFEKTPFLIGEVVKYTKFHQEMRSRDLKRAIRDLSDAGIITPIYSATAAGLPLAATLCEKKFKLLFLDIGLANRAHHTALKDLLNENLLLINRGGIAEQFVGQELLAYQDCYEQPELFYWSCEKASSHAEVDYLITVDSKILPLEVKAGHTGRLKSLRVFLAEKKAPLGIRVADFPLSFTDNVLTLPFYLISQLPRLLSNMI